MWGPSPPPSSRLPVASAHAARQLRYVVAPTARVPPDAAAADSSAPGAPSRGGQYDGGRLSLYQLAAVLSPPGLVPRPSQLAELLLLLLLLLLLHRTPPGIAHAQEFGAVV